MKVTLALLIVGVVGTIGHGADIDINRVKQISNQAPVNKELFQENYRQALRTNDYDDHSSWYQYSQRLTRPHALETSQVPVKIHQPREDPRLYYLSDAYLKEYPREKVNEEVTFVYPGQDVVRAGEPSQLSRIQSNHVNAFAGQDVNICVKCPHDLTLIAKESVGKVVLQNPTLRACSGRKAPRNVKFVHMYGPKIGSLLNQGSHMVIGRIMYKNKNLQLCKMQVHVVTQGCVTPKYLEAHCWDHNKQCNFTCINKHLELSGPRTQVCGDDMTWKGDLPVCKARTWCEFPSRRSAVASAAKVLPLATESPKAHDAASCVCEAIEALEGRQSAAEGLGRTLSVVSRSAKGTPSKLRYEGEIPQAPEQGLNSGIFI